MLKVAALVGIILLNPITSFASTTQCSQFFAGGVAPDLERPQLAQKTVPLCYDGFSLLYSGISNGPLYSAYHLTRASVQNAREAGRNGTFHPESQLPSEMQMTVRDFRNSPGTFWDKGHMTPNGAMPNAQLQEQTFTLANMVPQNATNNEVLHAGVEIAARDMALSNDNEYVVTGPVFYSKTLQRLNGKILIPTQIFTAVFDAKSGVAGVYVENNEPSMLYSVISLDQLKNLTGIDVFPSLPAQTKAKVAELPTPRPSRHGTRETKDNNIELGKPQLVNLEQLLAASHATALTPVYSK